MNSPTESLTINQVSTRVVKVLGVESLKKLETELTGLQGGFATSTLWTLTQNGSGPSAVFIVRPPADDREVEIKLRGGIIEVSAARFPQR